MEKMPTRKQVRLQDYDYSIAGAYFVTICTQNKSHLFGNIVGATLRGRPQKMIEKWLLEIENKFKNAKIDKYVIMPNHIHLIIFLSYNDYETEKGDHAGSPLQDIIGWLKTMTTNEYIVGVKAGIYPPFDKWVWQRSYHDRIIRNEAEYLKIWQYIDENLTRWEDDCYYAE